MSERRKSQRGFVAVTLITVLALAMVLMVYAVLLGSFQGGEVTVGGFAAGEAQIMYSPNNVEAGAWTGTLETANPTTPWYARLEIIGGNYSGPVTVTWQLENKTGTSTWASVGTTESTSVTLTGSTPQYVYVTANGDWAATNYDWSTKYTAEGVYRVTVTIDSA